MSSFATESKLFVVLWYGGRTTSPHTNITLSRYHENLFLSIAIKCCIKKTS